MMTNTERVKQLQQNAAHVRTGGKGTVRRKKKVAHKSANWDEKKLSNTLKKTEATNIAGIEEVNMIKEDGTVIHFTNPKVQAAVTANTFAIVGGNEHKKITDMLPEILSQLGPESLSHLKMLADAGLSNAVGNDVHTDESDDEIPALVDGFDEPSKDEPILLKK